ncbi:ssDNA-binding protein [Snodgrassella alvi]|uniref:ssDNA-binding protein n=1 Tax=Snodgrassella alvi TaxID=1196083 RepID=UPI0035183409
MKCILKGVRLSFPNLFQASSVNGSEPRFAANFLIEPDSENAKAVNTAVAQAAKDKWGAKAELELKN